MGGISPSNSTAVYQFAAKYSPNYIRTRCENDYTSPKRVHSCNRTRNPQGNSFRWMNNCPVKLLEELTPFCKMMTTQ